MCRDPSWWFCTGRPCLGRLDFIGASSSSGASAESKSASSSDRVTGARSGGLVDWAQAGSAHTRVDRPIAVNRIPILRMKSLHDEKNLTVVGAAALGTRGRATSSARPPNEWEPGDRERLGRERYCARGCHGHSRTPASHQMAGRLFEARAASSREHDESCTSILATERMAPRGVRHLRMRSAS
jgi:hypothetical protein